MAAVSVLIPTYNCADLLERAIHSVAAQTVAPKVTVEIVVVDDGSTDDTADRIHALQAAMPFLRYERQQNAGPAAARNRAIASARGELIAFLDADDVWAPSKLERQLPLFGQPDIGLVYCDVEFIDSAGRVLNGYERKIRMVEGDIVLALFCDFFLLTSAVMMRRDIAEREGGFRVDLPVGEDYDFFLRVLRRCKAAVVAEKLLMRTVRAGSLSRQDYALDARMDLDTLQRFASENPEFAAAHSRDIARRIGDYHGSFAYGLLADGKAREARRQALASLRIRANLPALKTYVRTWLPR